MPAWRTNIKLLHYDSCIETKDITFTQGIFQGDLFLLIIICLALVPLSNILKIAEVGYKLHRERISHLLYIYDLKMFAKNEIEMNKCRSNAEEFSNDIGIPFGLDKCAVMHTVRGKVITSPTTTEIPQLSGKDSYKYLGIL